MPINWRTWTSNPSKQQETVIKKGAACLSLFIIAKKIALLTPCQRAKLFWMSTFLPPKGCEAYPVGLQLFLLMFWVSKRALKNEGHPSTVVLADFSSKCFIPRREIRSISLHGFPRWPDHHAPGSLIFAQASKFAKRRFFENRRINFFWHTSK